MAFGLSVWGQNVTFRVDMQNENFNGPVRLTGGFAGWFDGKLEMLDLDNDNIYEISLELLPGRYEYKFLKGNWAGTELLTSPSAAYCTMTTNGNTNRVLQMGASDTILPVVCFDSCMACGNTPPPADVNVTFQVDMSALGSGSTYLTGNTLDNWCGNCISMSDGNGDLIYDVTAQMTPGFHEFKFTRNGWSNGEAFSPGGACTVTSFNFTNRWVFVPIGASSMSLEAAPFNGCAPHDVNMYLEVDMGNLNVDPTGVFVAGNFNNWNATSHPMVDRGHGIWAINVIAKYGDTLEYHFLNGATAETVPNNCADGNGARMRIVPAEMPRSAAECFGNCGPCQDALNLVWADEFNGTSIDTSKWNFAAGNGNNGWGNNELQFYSTNTTNANVNNGNLEITARQETIGGYNYTSARLHTRAKGDFTYGRIEASIKAPQGQGIWPAFWMFPTDEVYGGWPSSGEIDIMELIGSNPDRIHGTTHFGPSPGAGHFMDGDHYDLPGAATYADDFHVFAVEWEPNEIRWYMDSILYHSLSPWELSPCEWPFDQDMHIILNVAVGGNWPGNPDGSTQFPQTMSVEYVRVYGTGPVANAESVDLEQEVMVYPNPSEGKFNINFRGEGSPMLNFKVYDINGRIVLADELPSTGGTIELTGNGAGVYFLHLETMGGTVVKKLVKLGL